MEKIKKHGSCLFQRLGRPQTGKGRSFAKPQRLTDDLALQSNMLITMGCGETCPIIPGVKREDWPLADPKTKTPNEVRKIRNLISEKVKNLIAELGVQA